ncbi:IS4 family transposase [Candidatus Ozemobacteraceae bacterium]|nr:IS4 family transposase [Candidatus Ozemobacteraceae bacterium]
MNEGRLVLSQVLDFLPRYELDKCIHRYRGNRRIRCLSCYAQFVVMIFAQLTYRESLRDIVTCLSAMRGKLYHAGIRDQIARSTLADANESRDWRIFGDFAQILIKRAQNLLLGESLGVDLVQTAYALDSTTIDLCLSLFPWAKFRRAKGGIKLHTLLDLRGNIPSVVIVTPASVHDVNILDQLVFEPGAFYVMDRGYLDYQRLYGIHQASAFFVTRTKRNTQLRRRKSIPVDRTTGVRSDHVVVLTGPSVSKEYPAVLRRIRYVDPDTGKRLAFLTNNFELPATAIALLYKKRWQVELFFKWIKQHLRIKAFYGTSDNAIKTQIWIAISTYVLVAILKKELKITHSVYTILQVLSISLFERKRIHSLFSDLILSDIDSNGPKQLCLSWS